MKKVIIGFIIIILLIVLAIFSPWKNLDFSAENLLGVKDTTNISSLEVTSLNGEITISIDGIEKGHVSSKDTKFEFRKSTFSIS